MSSVLPFVAVAVVLIVLDIFVPSGGLLTGAGLALLIERALEAAGVALSVRVPLAAVGMLGAVGLAIRYGERISDKVSPMRARTNVDRLIGLEGVVRRIGQQGPIVELEGDLWTVELPEGEVAPGDRVRVTALVDQVPIVERL